MKGVRVGRGTQREMPPKSGSCGDAHKESEEIGDTRDNEGHILRDSAANMHSA